MTLIQPTENLRRPNTFNVTNLSSGTSLNINIVFFVLKFLMRLLSLRYESQIRDEYAPEIVKFDPVTDRDKIDIVEEQASSTNNKH